MTERCGVSSRGPGGMSIRCEKERNHPTETHHWGRLSWWAPHPVYENQPREVGCDD